MKKFNLHFLVFFIIVFSVSISDIIIYFTNFNFLYTNIVVLLFNLGSLILLKNKKKIEIKSDFSKFDFIFIFGLLMFTAFTIVFPDLSWDTRSYHIYLQENTFVDKINSDFFAGRNLNSFLFSLGDRTNYLFRLVLGYRLGTVMSYYLIVVLFYQVKRFFKELIKEPNEIFLSIISIVPCVMSIIFAFVGTYYIDNFGLVCLMEIFYIMLFEESLFTNKLKLYILAIIVGISISIKVTNVLFIIPIGLYFLLKNLKNFKYLKIYDYILLFICALLPFGIYALDNYIQTGNPVFPYYNNIFKSDFFMQSEWKDGNFGPENLIQFLIWPIYIVFNPSRAFDTKFVDLMWGIGFTVIIIYIAYSIINKKISNNKFVLACSVFITYYLWEKMLIGYVRYATVLLVMSSILVCSLIYTQFNNKKWISIMLSVIVVIAILPSLGYDVLVKIKDYNSINEVFSEYKDNLSLIFKDRKNEKIEIEGILGAIGDDSLIPSLIRKNNKIYNIEEWVTATNDKTKEMYENKILNKDIFVYCDKKTLDRKKSYLEVNNFDIVDEKIVDGDFYFLNTSDEMYLMTVRKIEF